MRRTLLVIGILVIIIVGLALYRVYVSNGRTNAVDVTALPGIYEGKATLVLSDYLKKMVEKVQTGGQKLSLDEPIPCKVEVKVNEKNEVTMELVDFKMPMEGIVLAPSICTVIEKDGVYSLKGEGSVNYGQQRFNYSHEGKIRDEELNAELTLTIIPMMAEPKVVFKGKRM